MDWSIEVTRSKYYTISIDLPDFPEETRELFGDIVEHAKHYHKCDWDYLVCEISPEDGYLSFLPYSPESEFQGHLVTISVNIESLHNHYCDIEDMDISDDDAEKIYSGLEQLCVNFAKSGFAELEDFEIPVKYVHHYGDALD